MFDTEIINRSIQGDLNSFRMLMEQSSPYAFSLAFRMTGDEDVSADIVQESMITVWKSIQRMKSAHCYKSWLYRIVINKCYDELRKSKNNPEITLNTYNWNLLSEKYTENPSTELENKEISEILNHLTQKLSPKQKAVFILSELEELTADEISEITKMSKTNIKANLHFARKKIGELFQNQFQHENQRG